MKCFGGSMVRQHISDGWDSVRIKIPCKVRFLARSIKRQCLNPLYSSVPNVAQMARDTQCGFDSHRLAEVGSLPNDVRRSRTLSQRMTMRREGWSNGHCRQCNDEANNENIPLSETAQDL